MGKALIILFVSLADLIAVYLTYSRSALIMLVAAVITYLALQKQKKLAFAAIVLLIAIIFFLPKQSHSTFTEGTNFLRITSGVERLDSIQTGVKIFEQSPVLGVGFNAYRYAQHKVGLTNIYWQVTHSGAGTDNGFLFVLTTAGIIGLTAFIYLLFCIFRQAKSQLKQNVHSVVLFAVLLGLILDGFFVNSLFYVLLLEWIWIFAALTEKS
jgi:O-antigen ligase